MELKQRKEENKQKANRGERKASEQSNQTSTNAKSNEVGEHNRKTTDQSDDF